MFTAIYSSSEYFTCRWLLLQTRKKSRLFHPLKVQFEKLTTNTPFMLLPIQNVSDKIVKVKWSGKNNYQLYKMFLLWISQRIGKCTILRLKLQNLTLKTFCHMQKDLVSYIYIYLSWVCYDSCAISFFYFGLSF